VDEIFTDHAAVRLHAHTRKAQPVGRAELIVKGRRALAPRTKRSATSQAELEAALAEEPAYLTWGRRL
jgi:hypothetical protein